MFSRFTIECAKHFATNWFNCLIVCPLWAKSDKYHSNKRVKLKHMLWKERAVLALGFCDQRKLKLLQASVNTV